MRQNHRFHRLHSKWTKFRNGRKRFILSGIQLGTNNSFCEPVEKVIQKLTHKSDDFSVRRPSKFERCRMIWLSGTKWRNEQINQLSLMQVAFVSTTTSNEKRKSLSTMLLLNTLVYITRSPNWWFSVLSVVDLF